MIDLNKIFYTNTKGNSIDYATLIELVNKKGIVLKSCAFEDTSAFFINFLRSVSRNIDITLVDPKSSISSTEENEIVGSKEFTIEELINSIKLSKSKITIFTSGTTGQPKTVIHSLSNLLREVRINEKQKNSIWALAYNPTHIAGLQVFLQAFCNSNTIIDIFGKGRSEIMHDLNNVNVTHVSATPTFYKLLYPINNALLTIKNVSVGGEKSDNSLYKKIVQMFPNAKINNIYASTEAGSIFSSNGSVFKIKDDLRSLIKIERNELFLNNDLTGEFGQEKEEWYATGDLVEWVDKDNGLFRFISRKNEMINVGGNKVNPQKVEEAILDFVGVSDCLVFAMQNSLLGNIICAKVVLLVNSISENDLKKHLRNVLEVYEIPRKISFVEKLEVTRTGKLKRFR